MQLLASLSLHQLTIRYCLILLLLLGLLFTPSALKAQSNLTLTIASTSEPDSSDTEDGSSGNERPVLIGEVVTYSLNFEIAEGSTSNVNVVAALPDGLEYIANSYSLNFTNDNGWSDTVSVSGGGSSGADVTFDFGTITNTDSDANTETIEIEFDVVVNNISTNQDGTQLTTNATLNANGSAADTSENRIVEVIEADLAVTKSIATNYEGAGLITTGSNDEADAGDEFTYRVQITNNGNAPAYDVALVDFIPIDYLEQFGSMITTGPNTGSGFTFNSGTGEWNFTWAYIDSGESVTGHLRIRVLDDVAPGESWDNTARIIYNSLPDTDGTDNNVPGALGDDDGARTGDVNDNSTSTDLTDDTFDTVDDYGRIATSSTVTVPDVELVKQIEHPINTPVVDDPSILYGATAGTVTEYVDSTDDPNTGTSEHDADNVDLAIGEEFNYIITVTLPEGTTYDLTMIDLASPNNQTSGRQNRVIELLSAEVIHVGGNLSGNGIESVGTSFSMSDSDGGDGDADRFQAWVGGGRDVFNNPDNVENDDDRYVIRVTARLDDEDAGQYNGGASDDHNDSNVQNRDGDTAQNKVQLQWDDQNGTTTTQNPPQNSPSIGFANNDMVEPDVDVTSTTIAGSNLQAGDTATFELTVTNNGTAPAYNLSLTDTLPDDAPNFSLTFDSVDTANSTCDDVSGFATNSSSPPNVVFSFDEVGAGSSCTIRFDTTVPSVTVFGATYTNSVTLTPYDSRDNAADDDNRNYSGGSDTSDVTTINITAAKAPFATSENHTSDTEDGSSGNERPVAIGEVVTFQLTTTLPEGSLDNILVSDALAAGLEFVDGTVTLYTNNVGSMSFTDIGGSVPTTSPGLSIPADTGGAPTDAGTYRYDSGTDTLEINLGDITNNDSDADTEEVIILFDAVVANTSSNDLGDSWTNDFSVSVDSGTPVTSNTSGVVVQEPNISITKTVNQTLSNPTGTTTFDGGDTVVYDIVVSNTSGTNVTDAFDLNITDTLDTNLSLDNVQLVGTISGTPIDNSTGNAVDVDIDQLTPGESLTIRLTTTVQYSVTLGQIINNTANLTYTSLPGTQGTGNATPGDSGDADGERNSDGSFNDYAASNDASFTVGGTVDAVKSIDGTSETFTADTSADTSGDPRPVVVGEIITYRLVTELPEVTSPDVVMTDTLAANIEYVTGSGRVSYSADNAATGSGNYGNNETEPTTIITPTFDSGSRELVFDIGEFVNNDNDGNVEQLIIEFEALVLDDAVNIADAQWNNEYTIDLDNNSTVEDTSNQVFAQIVQPELTLTKTRTDTGLVQIGDTVDFELTLTHTLSSTSDAFNVTITDTLPTSGMSLDSVTGGSCSSVSSGSGSGVLTFTVPSLTLADGNCTIQYQLTVGNDVEPNSSYTNSAVATYQTTTSSNQRTLTTNISQASFTTLALDVGISKSVTPTTAQPNQTITYTIQITHTGFTANNLVITDTLPAEITIQNVSTGGDVTITNSASNPTTEVFEIAQLASGQVGLITLTAQLDNNLSAGTIFTNSVVITSAEPDIDLSNNSAADTGVTVSNVAPTLAAIGNQTITETFELTFTAAATDNNNDTLTYGLSGEPTGASINSSSGLFSWTPTNAQGPGIYTFTVVVSDTAPLTDSQEIVVTVTDLDIDYSVAVDPTSLNEGNIGTQPVTFTVTRSGATDFASQVDYNFGGTATLGDDYSGLTSTLNFAADEISQTVSVNVLGDWVVEPDDSLSLTLTSGTSPSGGLVSYTPQSITTTILNDDNAGITVISSTTPLTISEPNSSEVFTIALTSQPTATVSIALTNTNSSECGLSATSVELNSGNWQTGLTVTVTAQDDVTTDGTQPCDITIAPATSSDANYAGLDPADVAVNVLDDDTPDVLVSTVSGDTTEAGGTVSFTVRLQTQPTAPVTITLQSSDLSEGQLDLAEIVFTSTTWNISQTVVITGIDDSVADGDQPYIIEIGNTQSNSLLYNNLSVDDVTVTNLDDDTAGVNVSVTDLSIYELGGSDVVTVSLSSQPTATVTINFASSDTGICTVSPTTLQFEPISWSTLLSITINSVDDDDPDGDRSCIVTGSVTSSDTIYDANPDVQINVTVEDDDISPIFFPIIFKRFDPVPDLIITDLQASSDSVQVTIQNIGTEAVTDGFWVDLYINPSQVPQYNDRWSDIAEAGVVWGVTDSDLPLPPGETRVLTLANATQTFNGETLTSSPPYPVGVPVYAQVDSVNTAGSFGGVEESDESNNVFGPITSIAGLGEVAPSTVIGVLSASEELPRR